MPSIPQHPEISVQSHAVPSWRWKQANDDKVIPRHKLSFSDDEDIEDDDDEDEEESEVEEIEDNKVDDDLSSLEGDDSILQIEELPCNKDNVSTL